jgi:hypothetical protein
MKTKGFERFLRSTLLLSVALCCACTTAGVGTGLLASPGKPEAEGSVDFRWSSGFDTTHGDISAVLPDGRVFTGRYLQMTSSSVSQYFDAWSPLGAPYYGGGLGGVYWEPINAAAFATYYSGRVLAQLDGPEGEMMRCVFALEDPVAGPRKGGLGDCELTTGERIGYGRLMRND